MDKYKHALNSTLLNMRDNPSCIWIIVTIFPSNLLYRLKYKMLSNFSLATRALH